MGSERTKQARALAGYLARVFDIEVRLSHNRGAQWDLGWTDGPTVVEMKAELDRAVEAWPYQSMASRTIGLHRMESLRAMATVAVAGIDENDGKLPAVLDDAYKVQSWLEGLWYETSHPQRPARKEHATVIDNLVSQYRSIHELTAGLLADPSQGCLPRRDASLGTSRERGHLMGWAPRIYLGRLSEARRREIGRVVGGAGALELDGDDVVWSAGERRGVELEVELGRWVSVAIAEARTGGENRRVSVLERAADDLSLITEQKPAVKRGSGGWVCELSPVDGHRPSIVWSSHTTELGAQRARASLTKAWNAQPHQLRGRWEWSTAPGTGPPVFRSRTEAVAAAGGIFHDARPSQADPDLVLASHPTTDSAGRPRVDITINTTSIGTYVGFGRELYETTDPAGDPSHRPYRHRIINFLFGRGPGDGVQLVTGPAGEELDQLLTDLAGPPGTAWSIPVVRLREAFLATGHFCDLNTLGDASVEDQVDVDTGVLGGPEVGGTSSSERSAALSDPKPAAGTLIGYARCSTTDQDLDAQRAALEALGVDPDRIYVDHGLSGASRDRPGLDQALAAVRAGDTLVVPKLDRLARSVVDARAIADQLVEAGVALSLAGQVYNPADPMGKMFFNILATFAEFERDLISQRTKEGMAIARKAGKLRGRRPSLTPLQDREIRRLHDAGEHTGTEIAEIFGVARATIYRSLDRTAGATS